MTTTSAFASGTPVTTGSSWGTASNATGANNAGFAVFTNATSGGIGTIQLPTFAVGTFSTTMAVVESVSATVYFNVATTSRWTSVTATLQDSTGTAIGAAVTLTLSATSNNSQTVFFGTTPTVAQINAGLQVLLTATHTGTTSSTFNLDAVQLNINATTFPGSTLYTDPFTYPGSASQPWASPWISRHAGATLKSTSQGLMTTAATTFNVVRDDYGSTAFGRHRRHRYRRRRRGSPSSACRKWYPTRSAWPVRWCRPPRWMRSAPSRSVSTGTSTSSRR